MFNKTKKALSLLIVLVLMAQISSCGLILHPERQGQRGGRVDAGIALLDAVGLLFFLVPGVIAFAVDFTTGTIYLPGSRRGSRDIDEMKTVKFDKDHATRADIERIIQEQTGVAAKLDQKNIEAYKMGSLDEMKMKFARAWPGLNYAAAAHSMK